MDIIKLNNTLSQEEIDHAPHLEALLETCDLDTCKQFLAIYDGDTEYLEELYRICVENLIDSGSSFKSFYVAQNTALDELFVQ